MSKQCCYFQRRVPQRWSTLKQCCEYGRFKKFKSKKEYFWASEKDDSFD